MSVKKQETVLDDDDKKDVIAKAMVAMRPEGWTMGNLVTACRDLTVSDVMRLSNEAAHLARTL